MRTAAQLAGPVLYFGAVLACGVWRHPAVLWVSAVGIVWTIGFAVYEHYRPRAFIPLPRKRR